MPVLDPLAAASRPMPPLGLDGNRPSRPLQFAATLHTLQTIDLNSQSHPNTLAHNKLPKPRKHQKDEGPVSYPTPQYSHGRSASVVSAVGFQNGRRSSGDLGSGEGIVSTVGSDEWMQKEVAKCVDRAQGVLSIDHLGLTSLSTKISDLRNLVTLSSTHSPRASPSPSSQLTRQISNINLSPSYQLVPTSPSSHPIPKVTELQEHQHLSPGSGHLSANARSFSRATSAPASSNFFNSLQPNPVQQTSVRKNFERAPSALSSGGILLASPTLTETSETESLEAGLIPALTATTASNALLPSFSMPAGPSNSLSPLAAGGDLKKRTLGRSKTGAVSFGRIEEKQGVKELSIYAGSNLLTSLPTALFEISNLTVLSLRSNKLTSIPAAIGELRNLKELNISNNQITELPSTILDLKLNQFWAAPNPFLKPPDLPSSSGGSPNRLLSRLTVNQPIPIPRLSTLCINILLSPRPPSHLPPLLDCYAWPTPNKNELHPLLSPEALHEIIPSMPTKDLSRILQSLRSGSVDFSNRRAQSSRVAGTFDPFPRSHKTLPADDASLNPYFSNCRSPRHLLISDDEEAIRAVRPTRHVFLHPAEERVEWLTVFGVKNLPVRWLGCSRGCLAFLEEDEEDDWSVEDDSGTDRWGGEVVDSQDW